MAVAFLIAVMLAGFVCSDGKSSYQPGDGNTERGAVSPVVISPAGEVFINRVDVTLACATPNVTVFYETNDFLEVSETSPRYQGVPIPLFCTGTVWQCSTTLRAQVGPFYSFLVSSQYLLGCG